LQGENPLSFVCRRQKVTAGFVQRGATGHFGGGVAKRLDALRANNKRININGLTVCFYSKQCSKLFLVSKKCP
jgi:hypothetical protein